MTDRSHVQIGTKCCTMLKYLSNPIDFKYNYIEDYLEQNSFKQFISLTEQIIFLKNK